MNEREVDVRLQSGAIDTFITCPQEGGPFTPVIIYMDIWGVREELFDIARRIATVGYYCMVPNFYHRHGRIRHEYRNAKNQMITLDDLDADKRERVLASLETLSDAMVIEDTAALLEFIDAEESTIHDAGVGCVGYCMGGRHVIRVAATFPDRFLAVASLHGTELVSKAPDSPHLDAANIKGELYCGFGGRDRHTPMDVVDAVRRSVTRNGVNYKFQVHKDANHGYALPDRDVYDKHSANRDWEIIFPMLARLNRGEKR